MRRLAILLSLLAACSSAPEPQRRDVPAPPVDLSALHMTDPEYRPPLMGCEWCKPFEVMLPRGAYRAPGWYDLTYPCCPTLAWKTCGCCGTK